jgi:DNA-directed RNA polymerase subunit RPC12/RpoP
MEHEYQCMACGHSVKAPRKPRQCDHCGVRTPIMKQIQVGQLLQSPEGVLWEVVAVVDTMVGMRRDGGHGPTRAFTLGQLSIWKRRRSPSTLRGKRAKASTSQNSIGIDEEPKGKTACLACGDSIDDGQRYFCVQRLRRLRGHSDFDNDETLDIMSSLQVCGPCMTKAETREIVLEEKPVPVLNLEKEAVRKLARSLGSWRSKEDLTTKCEDSCHFCRRAIVEGDTYTRIEIEDDVERGGAFERKEVVAVLATVCEECGKKYMIWL